MACGGREGGIWIEEEWEGGMRIFRLPGCVDNQGLLHLGTVDALGVAEEHEAGEPVGAGGGSADCGDRSCRCSASPAAG